MAGPSRDLAMHQGCCAPIIRGLRRSNFEDNELVITVAEGAVPLYIAAFCAGSHIIAFELIKDQDNGSPPTRAIKPLQCTASFQGFSSISL
jgi:hypothetical protein